MAPETLLLHGVVVGAALLQTVTGMGFAMIAGPVILLSMNDGSAIQVTTLLSLLSALMLAPGLARRADARSLRRFSGGAAFGLPFGLGFFAMADADLLKLAAGLTVGGLTALSLAGVGGAAARPGARIDLAFGAAAGFFGGCLAMPGPIAAVRLTAREAGKTITRATVAVLFVLIYPLVFLGQAAVAGGAMAAARTALIYTPSVALGVLAGWVLAPHVSERLFRGLVTLFLVVTAAALLFASLRGLAAGDGG